MSASNSPNKSLRRRNISRYNLVLNMTPLECPTYHSIRNSSIVLETQESTID